MVSEHLAGSAFLLSSFLLWTCVVAVVRDCECASLGTVAESVLCRGGVWWNDQESTCDVS
jgi:hypothetical protein